MPPTHDEVQKLRDTLSSLHRELDTVEARDPEVRRMLVAALQDIGTKLSARETGTTELADGGDGAGALTEAARQLEAEHPTVSATLRGVVEALSRMGI